MKAITLSAKSQEVLLIALKKIFPGYKRIELDITSNGIAIIFSKVGKFNPINLTSWSRFLNTTVPFLEVFLRDIPEALSKYGYANETFAPYFAMQVAMYGRTNGNNLVTFLEKTVNTMIQPQKRDSYEDVEREINQQFSGKTNEERVAHVIGIPKEILGGISFLDFFGLHKKE